MQLFKLVLCFGKKFLLTLQLLLGIDKICFGGLLLLLLLLLGLLLRFNVIVAVLLERLELLLGSLLGFCCRFDCAFKVRLDYFKKAKDPLGCILITGILSIIGRRCHI